MSLDAQVVTTSRTCKFRTAYVCNKIPAMINHTWHVLLMALAGWMNRQQQEVIEYLKEENCILREKLGPGRVLLSALRNAVS